MLRRLVIAFAVLTLVFTACGGDDDEAEDVESERTSETTAAGQTPPVSLPGQVNDHGTKDATSQSELELELDNFYFSPTFIKASAGQKLNLKIHNEGSAPHTLTSEVLSVDQEVQPDARADVQVTMPASGPVRFFCRFHSGQGMQGAFFFTAGATTPTTATGGATPTTAGGGGGY